MKTETTLKTITKEELRQKMNRHDPIQIVNVLSPEHYGLGFIQGSLRIPLAELDQRLNDLDHSRAVVTYCASFTCTASREAAEKLAAKGFQVSAYEGGIKEWKEAGYPMEPSGSREQSKQNPQDIPMDQPSGLSGLAR